MATPLFTSRELVLEYPTILGIGTSMRHLKMGYRFGEHPDLDLKYHEDIISYDKKSKHAAYTLTFKEDDSEYLIIKNRGTDAVFYPKYKQIHYLICCTNEEDINEEMIHIIRELKGISLCFALDMPNQKEILNFTQLL